MQALQNWRFCTYFFGLCGVMRALAGTFPEERGAALACVASCIAEAAVLLRECSTWEVLIKQLPLVAVLLGVTGYMCANLPAGPGERAKGRAKGTRLD